MYVEPKGGGSHTSRSRVGLAASKELIDFIVGGHAAREPRRQPWSDGQAWLVIELNLKRALDVLSLMVRYG